MKRLLFILFLGFPFLCKAQRSTGCGRGVDLDNEGGSLTDLINNSPSIIITLFILFVIGWFILFIVSSIVNRKHSKEQVWKFYEFANKYSKFQTHSSDGVLIDIVRLSGSLIRNNVQFDCSRFYYMSKDEMLHDDKLEVVRLIDGTYTLRQNSVK